jgi:hypothetical protein
MLKDRLELCGYFSLSSNYTLEKERKSFRFVEVAAIGIEPEPNYRVTSIPHF